MDEIKNEIAEQKSVNKKSLTLAVVKRILENKEAKQQMILLFEKKPTAIKEEIKQFLDQVNLQLNPSVSPEQVLQETNAQPKQVFQPEETTQPELITQAEPIAHPEQITFKEERVHFAKLYARTYVVAAHIYLEINNNEPHYDALIRDLPALKEFITAKFKVSKIGGTIDDMKDFSYKVILSGKNNGNAKGQLKPVFIQIVKNPAIFGADVSAFAENVLKDNSTS